MRRYTGSSQHQRTAVGLKAGEVAVLAGSVGHGQPQERGIRPMCSLTATLRPHSAFLAGALPSGLCQARNNPGPMGVTPHETRFEVDSMHGPRTSRHRAGFYAHHAEFRPIPAVWLPLFGPAVGPPLWSRSRRGPPGRPRRCIEMPACLVIGHPPAPVRQARGKLSGVSSRGTASRRYAVAPRPRRGRGAGAILPWNALS